MKHYLLALSFIVLASCNDNGTDETKDKNLLSTDLVKNSHNADTINRQVVALMPTLDFKDTTHDFGSIHEGEIVEYEFSFTNHGQSPLIIGDAVASCGCTAAGYEKDPIAPGKSSTMKVKFNSEGKSGHVTKTVTISDNTARATHLLTITADIKPKK